MRVMLIHPSALMYSEIYLRLEPLGLERVATAIMADGHDVRLIDLQVYDRSELERQVAAFRPEAIGFSLNYLANVPEVVKLAKWGKTVLPGCLIFAGGHSVSFVADQVLAHAEGAIDVVLKGEGETSAPALLTAAPDRAFSEVPGAVTAEGTGRPPTMLDSLDTHLPARHLGGRRRKYFMSVPEIVNITVQTPYPGTETWVTESRHLTTLDYRLFDVQHAVLPTRLPLHRNFVKMIWKFDKVYNVDRQYSDHLRETEYVLPSPSLARSQAPDRKNLYVHVPSRRRS